MTNFIRNLIVKYASLRLLGSRPVSKICWLFLRAYRNSGNYDMGRNGEVRLIRKLRPFRFRVCFDVGAHKGEWVASAIRQWNQADFFCFEPVPEFCSEIAGQVNGMQNVKVFQMTLGNEMRNDVTFFRNVSNPSMSSLIQSEDDQCESNTVALSACMKTGDEICHALKVTHIDFLKIDVEGYDLEVLKGFSGMLASKSIRVIQFENLSILSDISIKCRKKPYLREFIEFLGSAYRVGRLLPAEVEFFKYSNDEEIYGGNFVAILKEDTQLISALQ